MHQFNPKDNFNCGDTWPVGSFRQVDADLVVDQVIQSFDVPCWPEMTGLGEPEELLGFWMNLFLAWQEVQTQALIDETLQQRPGVAALLRRFKDSPLPVAKGQMLGPSTLLFALKKAQVPIIDRSLVLKFISQAYESQCYLLSKVAYSVIVSLDEPCAFLDKSVLHLWRELMTQVNVDGHFGLALHCCGPPEPEWLEFPWHVVHFDMNCLSEQFNKNPENWRRALAQYIGRGGWAAVGVIEGSSMKEQSNLQDQLDRVEEIFSGIGFETILISTTCGLDARTEKSLRDKLAQIGFASQSFLKNRKMN